MRIAGSGDIHILSFSRFIKGKKIQKKRKTDKAKGILGDLSDVEVPYLICLLDNLPNGFLK